jgi:uncharacterized protein involved in outer membrane biogenesis
MKTIVGAVVAIVLIAGIAAAFYLLSNLNSLVARAIEQHGSDATDTDVSVFGVDISLREGRGSITDLRVASPDGYEAHDAFSLGDIILAIDIKSVRKEPVVIDEIRIRALVVNAEITKNGASNIDELRKRVASHTATKAGDSDESSGETKRIRIKRFVFEEGKVEVDASALGLQERTIPLPEIRLNDVGGANGATPDEIAKIILATVAKDVTSEIAGSELDRLMKEKLGGSLTDKAKGWLKKLGN